MVKEGNTAAVITANSSYFAINQDHIRSLDQPGTIGYTVGDIAVATVYSRLCRHPGYTRHSSDCLSTGTAAAADITCCRCFRIWIYVVAVPENNSPHCCLWVFCQC